MFFFGHKITSSLSAFSLATLSLLSAAALPSAQAQTAPYVLPYTMSTYAGAHAAYTSGTPCGAFIALDGAGDGCIAPTVSVGTDPHDVRVDGKGNVFYLDNTSSSGVIHKINPFTGLTTIYVGSQINTKACGTQTTKYGDGCTATDGVANDSSTLYTAPLKATRGIGIAPNGDLVDAGYNDDYIHVVSATSGLMSKIAGTGSAGYSNAVPTLVNSPRGAGFDAAGNTYVADTGNNMVRVISTAGVMSNVTAVNTNATKSVTSNVPVNTALLSAPEDVQVAPNGNVYIADAGNNVIRAIYMGGQPFFGISAPIVGNIYTIAGSGAIPLPATATGGPVYTYPTDGTTPTAPGSSIAIGVRKIGIDKFGNLYIADSTWSVVWFVDSSTGAMRVLAGRYGVTLSTAPTFLCAASQNSVGDGCPASQSGLYANSNMGTMPDTQGNLYISDAEGAANAAGSRIRKVLSGLTFPAVATGASVTQSILIHFAPGDTPAASSPYTVKTTATDFTLGTPACTLQADNTDDCILPITFKPSQPGYDTAGLTITSTAGAATSYLISGYGSTAAVAFDPGNTGAIASTVSAPGSIVLDPAGNAYIADTANNRVLFYNAATATTSIFAGGASSTCGTSSDAFGDSCPATAAKLSAPRALAIDTTGSLYIADTGNNIIRKVSATGIISLYAGGASAVCAAASNPIGDNCAATSATFESPSGLTADNLGSIYVADTGNNLIRVISSTGYVSTLAGGANTVCSSAADTQGDGCSASQTIFSAPSGLAFDDTGKYLIVADTGNNIVRKIYLSTTFSVTSNIATGIAINPVTLVAGNGQAGSSVDSNSVATLSQLNAPSGVAVDPAGNVYIADTANHAVRMVTSNGVLSTIVGITGASGTGTLGGAATATQLSSPSSLAITPLGTLFIADSGNNRILFDLRYQVAFNFGRTQVGSPSPILPITQTNIGTVATPASSVFTQAPSNSQFTLIPAANSNSSIPACPTSSALAPGGICNLNAQFSPTATSPSTTVVYTETFTPAVTFTPTISLTGTGAVLTPTTSTIAQTIPATGNSQFGGSVTLTVSVSAASCNTTGPTCYPTGSVIFTVGGINSAPQTLTPSSTSTTTAVASLAYTGLSVGPHTISCSYSTDGFYSSSVCPAGLSITVAQSSTTSTIAFPAATNKQSQFPTSSCFVINDKNSAYNGDTECTQTTLTTTVVSNTSGVPTGTVNFLVNGASVGTAPLGTTSGATNATAQLSLFYIYDNNGILAFNSSLAPGTYTLTCTYSPTSSTGNFSGSTCSPVSFVVVAQTPAITLTPRGCVPSSIYMPGTSTAGLALACPYAQFVGGVPNVAVAQGSTTDATLFITPTNTVAGTLTFSCSGLPANSTCTFSPTSLTLSATSTFAPPVYTDVTFWTDLQPGTVPGTTAQLNAPTLGHTHSGVNLAAIIGWPLTLLGLGGLLLRRRKLAHLRGLTLMALAFVMAGTALTFTGCSGGPGAYHAVLTPAGTYPITVTVKGANLSQSTVIDFTVTSPGIPGQQ
jgi:sugar lactone lactonase YvrE